MESVTTITPQQAADALGLDLYTLARQLRESASKDFARIAEHVGNNPRLPWSVSETEEEIEKAMRLLASAEECKQAYEQQMEEALKALGKIEGMLRAAERDARLLDGREFKPRKWAEAYRLVGLLRERAGG